MHEKFDSKVYFWPYDIFGYLLPGIVAIAPLIEFHKGIRELFTARYQSDSIADNIVLLVAVYVVGHIVSAASSLVLERGLLRLSFGYPLAQFLFANVSSTMFRNLVLVIANPSRWFLLRDITNTGRFLWLYRFIRFASQMLDRRLELIPGFCHPYNDAIAKIVLSRFTSKFCIQTKEFNHGRGSHEIYWTIWAYIAENMPNSYRTGMHFLELYGFCRNSSFAFLVATLYPFLPGWNLADKNGNPLLSINSWMLTCGLCCILLYSNFTKLLRRQNDFVLRAFISEKGSLSPSDGKILLIPSSISKED